MSSLPPEPVAPRARGRRLGRLAAISLGVSAVTALLFALVEGISSTALLAYDVLARSHRSAVRSHTMYDAELGWVNRPSLLVPDLYGPGNYMRTNARGFRNDEETLASTGPGRVRIVCSGDSFTMGHGVANDESWCNRLSALDSRIEAVNMGQGGYGIDQAYLWYRRDAAQVAHDVQLFAFITTDFHRMEASRFLGYEKPVLRVRDGRLVAENVPVPRRSYRAQWLTESPAAIGRLRSVVLLSRIFGVGGSGRRTPESDSATFDVAARVFDDLAAINARKGSRLVLVYLPTLAELRGRSADAWRDRARRYAERSGVGFLDLVEPVRALPYGAVQEMFIPDTAEASGHYTEAGNARVADLVLEAVRALPEVRGKLEAIGAPTLATAPDSRRGR